MRGNRIAAVGMAIAVSRRCLIPGIGNWGLIVLGIVIGTAVGVPAARQVKMTAMPQMVALFNGVGGGAVALIAWSEFRNTSGYADEATYVAIFSLFSAIVGSISFWGSNIAFAKLQELIPGRPITIGRAQQFLNLALLVVAVACAVAIASGRRRRAPDRSCCSSPRRSLGNMFVLPIGGADMPVVISLLNAFTGLSAAAAGIALNNIALIVAGMIVGASGTILTQPDGAGHEPLDPVDRGGRLRWRRRRPAGGGRRRRHDRALDQRVGRARSRWPTRARSSIVPGYGMAVAQAQHAVREMTKLLEDKGVEVKFAIHPVAGRMPGHMNVLLAEADVPVRPAQGDGRHQRRVQPHRRLAGHRRQRRDEPRRAQQARLARSTACRSSTSTRSRSVIVLKRSMSSGFAGIDNPLFYNAKTAMLFGDAKSSVSEITEELKAL